MTELNFEKEFKAQKEIRLKEIKELDKMQSKVIVDNYRDNMKQIMKEEEYLKIVNIIKLNYNIV